MYRITFKISTDFFKCLYLQLASEQNFQNKIYQIQKKLYTTEW